VESGEQASALLKRAALAEGVHAALQKPVLHGDNGAALKSTTVLAMLHWLGITLPGGQGSSRHDNKANSCMTQAATSLTRAETQFARRRRNPVLHRPQQRLLLELGAVSLTLSLCN